MVSWCLNTICLVSTKREKSHSWLDSSCSAALSTNTVKIMIELHLIQNMTQKYKTIFNSFHRDHCTDNLLALQEVFLSAKVTQLLQKSTFKFKIKSGPFWALSIHRKYLIFLTIQPQDESFLTRINHSEQKHHNIKHYSMFIDIKLQFNNWTLNITLYQKYHITKQLLLEVIKI